MYHRKLVARARPSFAVAFVVVLLQGCRFLDLATGAACDWKKMSQQQLASFHFKRAGHRVASGILLDKTLVYCVSGALRRLALMANDSLRFCLDFCSSGFSVRQRTTG